MQTEVADAVAWLEKRGYNLIDTRRQWHIGPIIEYDFADLVDDHVAITIDSDSFRVRRFRQPHGTMWTLRDRDGFRILAGELLSALDRLIPRRRRWPRSKPFVRPMHQYRSANHEANAETT